MSRPRVLVATRSPHKLEEIRALLGEMGVDVELVSAADLGLPRLPEEEEIERHATFAENALAKARHFRDRTGLPTFADDSGLCVDALGGGPGVRTKRFAPERMARRWGRDEANNRHLLRLLEGVPDERRGAHYRCAVAAVGASGREARTDAEARADAEARVGAGPGVRPAAAEDAEERDGGEEPFVVEGRVDGRIAREPRGEGGFGYDPVFLFPSAGGTFAELPPEVKARHSHRAEAVRKLRPWLEGIAG